MRIHIVANPMAGRGRAPRLLADLERALAARGAAVSVHRTSGPGDATAHVAGLPDAACDRLVVLGGDGTLHEVVNGRPSVPWPVAMVPLGTANLVARDAGLPLRPVAEAHAATVLDGVPWTVDLVGTDRGRTLAVLGVGLDAEVVRAVAEARRGGVGGYTRWLLPIARTFLAYRPPRLRVTVDGTTVEGGAVVVQNAHNYGGLFELSRDARMDDGCLDVVVLRDAGRRDHFRMLLRAYGGRLHADRGVTVLRGRTVAVDADVPVAVQADGDPAGTTPLRAEVLPRALTLLAARRAPGPRGPPA